MRYAAFCEGNFSDGCKILNQVQIERTIIMKKNSKIVIAVIAVLIALTAALAIVHSATRTKVPDGALLVSCGGEKEYVDLKSLDTVPMQGTVVNGKGEESEIDTQGVSLADVIEKAGFDPDNAAAVKVTADDEFSAELTGGEVNEAGKAYLVCEDDGSMRLVVFGDSNAKRNVRNVVSVDISIK